MANGLSPEKPPDKALLAALRINRSYRSARLHDRDAMETFGWEKEQTVVDFAAEMAELVEL